MMKQLKCYRIELPTTNGLKSTYRNKNGKYIEVDYGILHALAHDVLEIGESFPDALKIEELGIGVICGDVEEG
jgi:hypothetical protein